MSLEGEAQHRQTGSGQTEMLAGCREAVVSVQRLRDWRFVIPEVHRRTQRQLERPLSLEPVLHDDRILPVGHEHPLFQRTSFDLVTPHRNPGVQVKIRERADVERFPDGVQKHHAAERVAQCRHEQTVVAPRDHARDRSRAVAADAVGHEPFVVHE